MKLLDKVSIYYLVIAFLLLLYFLGVFNFGLAKILWQAIPPLLATVVLGGLFDYLETKTWQPPLTPLITGLIIGLVAQFGGSLLTLMLIGAAAMTIKFLIKLGNHHVFNPAGGGLFLGMMLFSSAPSWWAGEYLWVFLIWIPILLYKLKRWAPMAGFLLPLILKSGFSVLTSGSLLFFISVMLIEPKTSPATVRDGLIYGLVVATCYLIISSVSEFDPLIPSLLIGNLTARIISRYI